MDFLIPSSPEPDSYPTNTTPISTPEGSTTRNVVERRRIEKKNEEEELMKNADLIIFLYIYPVTYSKNSKKKNFCKKKQKS